MGFGNIISALAAVTAILLAVYVFTTGAIYTADTLAEASRESHNERAEQLESSITITNVSSDDFDVYVTLENTGHTKIGNYVHMDAIIWYYSPPDDIEIEWISYSEADSPSSREWVIEEITPDSINPGIFDPDEQMKIQIEVSSSIKNMSAGNWLQITTPNGASSSKYFTG